MMPGFASLGNGNDVMFPLIVVISCLLDHLDEDHFGFDQSDCGIENRAV